MKVYIGNDDNGHPIYEALNRPATIRDVTRHTAGFSRGTPGDPIAEIYRSEDPTNYDNTLTEMAAKLGRVPLGYHPGERWLYGDSVDVQAFLVERLSGQPFDEYLKEHIFNPLGMKETGYYFVTVHGIIGWVKHFAGVVGHRSTFHFGNFASGT